VRRRVPGFEKRRYPTGLEGRRIREPLVEAIMLVPGAVVWLAAAPVALLFQSLPEAERRVLVRVPPLVSA
jgi:hypothetical protein